jgi:hypothetical protein
MGSEFVDESLELGDTVLRLGLGKSPEVSELTEQ